MVVVEVKGKYSNKLGDNKAAEVQVNDAVYIEVDANGYLILKDDSEDVVHVFQANRWWNARLLKDEKGNK